MSPHYNVLPVCCCLLVNPVVYGYHKISILGVMGVE